MKLNTQQEIAAKFDKGHVLVLAGAGTGKTRTIIARAAYLIEKGVQSNKILLLTFTRRAASEMKDRLYQIVGSRDIKIQAGTFHHFCLFSMRRMPSEFGIANSTVIDRDDQNQLMKLIRAEFMKKGEKFPRASELVSLCSFARNTVQPIENYLDRHTDYDQSITNRISLIAKAFDQRKRANNYLDYDDILFIFAKRLHEDPNIRKRLRGFYDHILVDEMQDTNPLQWLILDGLRDPAQLFCVGDDAQSIYAFRGADFRNVHSFTKRIPNATVLLLEKNYRSTQGILDLSNWLLKQSNIGYNKNLTAHRKAVTKPYLYDFPSEFDEARWITDDLIKRNELGVPWKDHLIITRTGFGARTVEAYMIEKDIPYRFVGGVSLLHAAHVKDLFSLIRSTASHHDELAWARYLTLWPRIGNATAAKLIKGARNYDSFKEAIEYLKKALKNRKDILKGVDEISKHWENPSVAILKAGKFLTPLMEKSYINWKKRKHDFDLLAKLAKSHRSLIAFLETYTLDPISTSDAERFQDNDVVTLSTAHSAKGTEARVCYLIKVEPGMYPHFKSFGSRDDEEEERRILYVAMTRAKDELILTRTLQGSGFTRMPYSAQGSFDAKRSYFFNDISSDLIETDTLEFDNFHLNDYDVISPWKRD